MTDQIKEEVNPLYAAVIALYSKKLEESLGNTDYMKKVLSLVDSSVANKLERVLSAEIQSSVKSRLEEENYPKELVEEVLEIMSKEIKENFADKSYIPRFFKEGPVQKVSKESMISMLEKYRGNVSRISKQIGINRVTTYAWMKDYQLDPKEFREKK